MARKWVDMPLKKNAKQNNFSPPSYPLLVYFYVLYFFIFSSSSCAICPFLFSFFYHCPSFTSFLYLFLSSSSSSLFSLCFPPFLAYSSSSSSNLKRSLYHSPIFPFIALPRILISISLSLSLSSSLPFSHPKRVTLFSPFFHFTFYYLSFSFFLFFLFLFLFYLILPTIPPFSSTFIQSLHLFGFFYARLCVSIFSLSHLSCLFLS